MFSAQTSFEGIPSAPRTLKKRMTICIITSKEKRFLSSSQRKPQIKEWRRLSFDDRWTRDSNCVPIRPGRKIYLCFTVSETDGARMPRGPLGFPFIQRSGLVREPRKGFDTRTGWSGLEGKMEWRNLFNAWVGISCENAAAKSPLKVEGRKILRRADLKKVARKDWENQGDALDSLKGLRPPACGQDTRPLIFLVDLSTNAGLWACMGASCRAPAFYGWGTGTVWRFPHLGSVVFCLLSTGHAINCVDISCLYSRISAQTSAARRSVHSRRAFSARLRAFQMTSRHCLTLTHLHFFGKYFNLGLFDLAKRACQPTRPHNTLDAYFAEWFVFLEHVCVTWLC